MLFCIAYAQDNNESIHPIAALLEPPSTMTSPSSSSSLSPPTTNADAPGPSAAVEFKVYRPPTALDAPPPPTLSDDYFTPTTADIRSRQAELQARRVALTDRPLELKATREVAEKARRERWPETRIRVKFPDQTMLERKFPSTDKIRSVYAFVRACLTDEAKPIKFILYQSPPKRDLKVSDPNVRDQTLYDLHLTPSSVLLLRFEDESMNHDQAPAPLLPSILEQAIDIPVPPAAPAEPTSPPKPSTPAAPSAGSRNNDGGEKKIPKWLKLGKK
ncbi:hypothetical protein D9611_001681 [Ephemerocybe angulata]|uniref:UBX domain-containing protein n=1 Tax=Ephemerocybe angulata TaxID=980116 RepID=A0A8H5FMB0_9AGAR|nr:hypothetical protein D9611_001681 [Tulosesus angulatus]